MVADAELEVVDVQVSGLRQAMEPFQPVLQAQQLRCDSLQSPALRARAMPSISSSTRALQCVSEVLTAPESPRNAGC